MSAPAGVLLAAGAGTRLGRGPKALLPRRGATLVEHLAQVLLAGGCREVVVVLGSEAERVLASTRLPTGARAVVNPDWAEGMGSSFRLGVRSTARGTDVLVALVDQPGLRPELLRRLAAAHAPGRVSAAGYPGPDGVPRRGHPVLFDAALAGRAAAGAAGDAGAREFLRVHPELVDVVDCGDLGDGRDIDRPADLALLER